MPVKSFTKSVKWYCYSEVLNSTGSSVVTEASTSSVYTDTVDIGGPIPSYQKRIALLQGATTHINGRDRRYLPGGNFRAEVTHLRKSDKSTERVTIWGETGSGMGIPSTAVLSLNRANNRALMSFVNRANDEIRELQALVSFGELGETLRMIRNPLKSVWSGMRSYLSTVEKRGRRRRNRPHLHSIVSDTWLEYSFGWRPLVNDVESAAKALAKYVSRTPVHSVVNGSGSEIVNTASRRETISQLNLDVYRLVTDGEEASVRYKGCVRTANVQFHGSLDTFGISPWELIPTVWELIPYSFLVDYFTNAGQVIAGASFNRSYLSWVVKGTSLTRFREASIVGFNPRAKGAGWVMQSKSLSPGGTARYEDRLVTRADYTGSYIPSLEFTIPGLGLKWLNIAALLGSSRSASRRLAGI